MGNMIEIQRNEVIWNFGGQGQIESNVIQILLDCFAVLPLIVCGNLKKFFYLLRSIVSKYMSVYLYNVYVYIYTYAYVIYSFIKMYLHVLAFISVYSHASHDKYYGYLHPSSSSRLILLYEKL